MDYKAYDKALNASIFILFPAKDIMMINRKSGEKIVTEANG
ncbi:hypothetical protein [uncultured Dysosmobacter sp.]|nr:hypothetical protein [uncultured Dysosmobacter sp.]